MKVKNFTFLWFCTLLVMAMSVPLDGYGQANGSVACNDLIQISLDAECNGVTPDMFLEGDAVSPTPVAYGVVIETPAGSISGTADVLADNPPVFKDAAGNEIGYPIGGPYKYTITAMWANGASNTCWGNVIFEANLIPETMGGACNIADGMSIEDIACEISCGGDPWSIGLSTEDQIWAMLPACLDGELQVTENVFGDLCSGSGSGAGAFHEITYVLEVVQHGVPAWIPLFKEGYWERPIALGDINCPAEAADVTDLVPGTGGIDKEEALLALMGMPTDVDGDGQDGLSNVIDNWIQTDGELSLPCSADYTPDGIATYFDDPKTSPGSGSKLPHIMEGVFMAYPWYFADIDGDGALSSISEVQPIIPGDGKSCNLITNYSDTEFDLGGNTKKILRQWQVIDWCTGDILTCDQLILIGDNDAPVFDDDDLNPAPLNVSIAPWTCKACFTIPALEHPIKDGCSDFSVVVVFDFGKDGAVTKGIGSTMCLDEGVHTMTYVATDANGNSSTLATTVIVSDDVPPVPVCEDELVVSLTPDQIAGEDGGVAKIFAESFDNGSHDAGCGPVWFKVIRMDELNGTRHGYWNFNNSGVIPYYDEIPDDNPAAVCNGANGDDFADCEMFAKDGSSLGYTDTGVQVFFDDFVKFCCDDVDSDITVVLRVYDQDPGAGPVQPWRMDQDNPYNWILPEQFGVTEECTGRPLNNDLAGTFNDCMITVKIQVKFPTVLVCPDDVAMDCEDSDDPAINAGLGMATAEGVCGDPCVAWFDVSDDVGGNNPSCGARIIYRSFFVDTDCDGVQGPLEEFTEQCHQLIFVSDTNEFDPNTIKWPVHYVGGFTNAVRRECNPNFWPNEPIEGDNVPVFETADGFFFPDPFDCMGEEPTCEPEWVDPGCGLVGSSVDVDTVYFEDDACVKILKKWAVIDWCTWVPNSQEDLDQDGFEWVEDWTPGVCEPETCSPYYARYTSVDVDGYYNFTQVIKVINTTAPELENCEDVCIPVGEDCHGDLVIMNTATDAEDCASNWLKWNIEIFNAHWELIDYYDISSANGEKVTIDMSVEDGWDSDSNAEGHLPVGTYRVRWTVTDGCNNTTSCLQFYTLADKKAPTPYCIQNLSSAVMDGSGCMEIWASDFNQKSIDNCTAESDLLFSFSGEEYVPSVEVCCDDIANGVSETFNYEMWVWDAEGNRDFCVVSLRVDDNVDACDDGGGGSSLAAMVQGDVVTEDGTPIDNVEVMLSSTHPEYPSMIMTEDDGEFSFASNPMSFDYNVEANRNDNHMNGVSTLDLVLIQKHILGISSLSSAYKVIAADVNKDGRVSAIDLVELRKLILGIYAELPNNTSWVFVDASQDLNVTNPWPYNSSITINGLESDMMNEDFIGIKVGDVSGNAVANSFTNTEARSIGNLILNVRDMNVVEGQEISVPVTANKFNDVYGFQFSMDHNGLSLVDVIAGDVNIIDENVAEKGNSLSMSWNSSDAVTSNDVLFTLVFKANNSLQLSDAINISSNSVRAEAYTSTELNTSDVHVEFLNDNGQVVNNTFVLYQNEPNPFEQSTTVSFILPNAGNAKMTVMDAAGKVLKVINAQYSKGYNTIELDKSELGTAGVLIYQLESGEYTATKKMVVID